MGCCGGDVLSEEDGRARRLSAQAAYMHLRGGRKGERAGKNKSQEKTAANWQIHANSLSKKLSLEVGLSPGEQPDCLALTGETLCLLE